MDYILNWYTFWGLIMTLGSFAVAAWFLGLWPVIIATLNTSAGRKAVIVAAGGFLFWVFSIFLYTRGKQKALDALKANSQRMEDERNKRDAELQNLPADKLRERGSRWMRDG